MPRLKRVVAAPQPLQLELAPLAHVDPVLGAGRHRAQRRQQQFLQRYWEAPGLPARIVQVFKALHQLVAWGGRRVVWHRVVGWRGRAGLLPLNRDLANALLLGGMPALYSVACKRRIGCGTTAVWH